MTDNTSIPRVIRSFRPYGWLSLDRSPALPSIRSLTGTPRQDWQTGTCSFIGRTMRWRVVPRKIFVVRPVTCKAYTILQKLLTSLAQVPQTYGMLRGAPIGPPWYATTNRRETCLSQQNAPFAANHCLKAKQCSSTAIAGTVQNHQRRCRLIQQMCQVLS